jgi:NAD(P)-dependent dehydrogenase (short-subunit alcohol dehydrogenase family)
MTSRALVTGSAEPVAAVAAALRAAGAEVVAVTDVDRISEELRAFAPGSLDCYIQLPVMIHPTGDTVVARVRAFLDNGILTRFRLAEAVLPVLSDEGRVLLVRGHTMSDGDTPDDQAARKALLHVLAHSIRADKAPANVRVRVVSEALKPADIARIALRGESISRRPVMSFDLAAREEEKSYQDWRTEIMGLVSVEF